MKKVEITKHPRLENAVELLAKNSDGIIYDTTSFAEDTIEKSVEEAKLYAECFYPGFQVEVKGVQLSNGL